MPSPSIPHAKLSASDSFESCELPYPIIEPVKPSRHSAEPDHHGILRELTFHAVHSRLLEIELKMSRLEASVHDAFSRLESNLARCHRTIEQVNGTLLKAVPIQTAVHSAPPREMVVKMKFGRKGQKHSISDANQLGHFLSSPSTSFQEGVVKRRRSSVLSRIKNHVKGAFSVPRVMTPVFEVYPANMISTAGNHPPVASMTTDIQPK